MDIQRIGFACKYLHPDQTLKKQQLEECQRPLNTKCTTVAWLNRQERNDLEEERDAAETVDTIKTEQSDPKNELAYQNKKDDKDERCLIQAPSSSSPSQTENDNIHPKPVKKKKKKRSKRKRRNKKQLEENSKIRILVAESDEVSSQMICNAHDNVCHLNLKRSGRCELFLRLYPI